MDLERLYGASYINWVVVAESWAKKTLSSRLLLFSARHYLEVESGITPDESRKETIREGGFPEEIVRAFAAPPPVEKDSARKWGEFADAALRAELEMISYGERPPVLDEIRKGLSTAASEAGTDSPLGSWFAARVDALPGSDLPEDPGYIPV